MTQWKAAMWYALQAIVADADLPPDFRPGLYAQLVGGWIEVRILSISLGMVTIGRVRSEDVEAVAKRLTDAEYATWLAHEQSAKARAFDLVQPYAADLEVRRLAPLQGKTRASRRKAERARQLEKQGLSHRAIARRMLAEGTIKSEKPEDDPDVLDNARRTVQRWLNAKKSDGSRTVT